RDFQASFILLFRLGGLSSSGRLERSHPFNPFDARASRGFHGLAGQQGPTDSCLYARQCQRSVPGRRWSGTRATIPRQQDPFELFQPNCLGLPKGTAPANKRSAVQQDRKSTRLNSSHLVISYAVFCLKKKKKIKIPPARY